MAGLLQLFSPNTPTQNLLVTGSQLRHFGMSCRLDFFFSIFIITTVTLSPTVYIKTPILFIFFWINYIWNLNWWNLKHAIPIVLLYLEQVKIGGNRIYFQRKLLKLCYFWSRIIRKVCLRFCSCSNLNVFVWTHVSGGSNIKVVLSDSL